MAIEDEIKKSNFRGIIFTSIITALALVVGLFWRDAITALIERIVPAGEGVFYKFMAAIAATIIVVMMAYILVRWQNLAEKRALQMKKNKSGKKGLLKLR